MQENAEKSEINPELQQFLENLKNVSLRKSSDNANASQENELSQIEKLSIIFSTNESCDSPPLFRNQQQTMQKQCIDPDQIIANKKILMNFCTLNDLVDFFEKEFITQTQNKIPLHDFLANLHFIQSEHNESIQLFQKKIDFLESVKQQLKEEINEKTKQITYIKEKFQILAESHKQLLNKYRQLNLFCSTYDLDKIINFQTLSIENGKITEMYRNEQQKNLQLEDTNLKYREQITQFTKYFEKFTTVFSQINGALNDHISKYNSEKDGEMSVHQMKQIKDTFIFIQQYMNNQEKKQIQPQRQQQSETKISSRYSYRKTTNHLNKENSKQNCKEDKQCQQQFAYETPIKTDDPVNTTCTNQISSKMEDTYRQFLVQNIKSCNE